MSAGDSSHAAPSERRFATLEWRPACPDDEPFLDELYEGTRLDEVLGWGFDPASARAFLREQAHIQRRAYLIQYPDAEHRVILADGVAAGRIILSRGEKEWSIIDVSMIPARRGSGIGAWAIQKVQEAAAAANMPVLLHVAQGNRARALYERLGFREASTSACPCGPARQPLRLEWRPP